MDLRAWARVAAIASLALIVVLSVVPGSARPHMLASGNLEHLGAYAGAAFLVVLGFTPRMILPQVAALSAMAGLSEVFQIWIPGRHAEVANWAASSAGVVIGATTAVIVARSLMRRAA